MFITKKCGNLAKKPKVKNKAKIADIQEEVIVPVEIVAEKPKKKARTTKIEEPVVENNEI